MHVGVSVAGAAAEEAGMQIVGAIYILAYVKPAG